MPLGNKVNLPCNRFGTWSEIRWMFKSLEGETVTIITKDPRGVTMYNTKLKDGKQLLTDSSLEISHFTEQDIGMYFCTRCMNTKICTDGEATTLLPNYGK